MCGVEGVTNRLEGEGAKWQSSFETIDGGIVVGLEDVYGGRVVCADGGIENGFVCGFGEIRAVRTGEVEGDGGREDAIQMEGREKTSQRSNIAEGMTQGFIQWHRLRKLQPVLKQYNFYLYYLDFSCSFPHRKVDIVISQGLGSPIFDKLEAELAKAVMSLLATNILKLAYVYAQFPLSYVFY